MNAMRAQWKGIPLGLVVAALLCGCGQGESSTGTADTSGREGASEMTASIGGVAHADYAEDGDGAPAEGTAEWALVEIIKLRRTPISTEISAEEVATIRAERHRQIVKLALDAIKQLLNDPSKEELFNEAVKQLMEAQLELALVDPNEVETLYENRDIICQQVPKSKAAAEAAFAVARFAHTRARDFARQEPRWLDEFSRQALSFAQEFPTEEARSVSLLYAAGTSCELHGKREEAMTCYNLLRELFPKSPQAQQIVAVLRRLQLAGKPVQLAGETLDGRYLSIDKFAGKPVIIVFWSSDNPQCQTLLPNLIEIADRYQKHGLSLIGVNLDDDQKTVEAYLNDRQWTWPQVFDSNESKRRWKHDVVKFYGVRNIPLVWLVDANGIVVDAQADTATLDEQIQSLLN